jgi:hypothetical protein
MEAHVRLATVLIGLIGCAGIIGCREDAPPPQRVPVPSANGDTATFHRDDEIKPLPQPRAADTTPPPPFNDEPIVDQQPPEQPAFVDAYHRVGSPKIVLFVNRTLQGEVVPTNSHGVQTLDYEAIENIMTDWLAADGQVTLISPIMARQRLSDEQVRELQQNRPLAMSEAVHQLGADIFIQVNARPTRQTSQGLEIRIIAEAINTKGGESLARAVVDVPPPLEKTTINKYTRFLSRKLMDGMISAWLAPPPPEAPQAPAPPATPTPAPAPPPVAPPPAPAPQSSPPSTSPAGTTTFLP